MLKVWLLWVHLVSCWFNFLCFVCCCWFQCSIIVSVVGGTRSVRRLWLRLFLLLFGSAVWRNVPNSPGCYWIRSAGEFRDREHRCDSVLAAVDISRCRAGRSRSCRSSAPQHLRVSTRRTEPSAIPCTRWHHACRPRHQLPICQLSRKPVVGNSHPSFYCWTSPHDDSTVNHHPSAGDFTRRLASSAIFSKLTHQPLPAGHRGSAYVDDSTGSESPSSSTFESDSGSIEVNLRAAAAMKVDESGRIAPYVDFSEFDAVLAAMSVSEREALEAELEPRRDFETIAEERETPGVPSSADTSPPTLVA